MTDERIATDLTRGEVIHALASRMSACVMASQRAASGARSDAQALLAYDLALHVVGASTLLAQKLYSPAASMIRLILERAEYLEAAGYDEGFAKRYLATRNPEGSTALRAGEQRSALRTGWIGDGLTQPQAQEFLDAHREIADIASGAVHPTALMPSVQFAIANGIQSPEEVLQWIGSAVAFAGLALWTSTPKEDRQLPDAQQTCALAVEWMERFEGIPMRDLLGPDLVTEIPAD